MYPWPSYLKVWFRLVLDLDNSKETYLPLLFERTAHIADVPQSQL
jgi:hypothetical protein